MLIRLRGEEGNNHQKLILEKIYPSNQFLLQGLGPKETAGSPGENAVQNPGGGSYCDQRKPHCEAAGKKYIGGRKAEKLRFHA